MIRPSWALRKLGLFKQKGGKVERTTEMWKHCTFSYLKLSSGGKAPHWRHLRVKVHQVPLGQANRHSRRALWFHSFHHSCSCAWPDRKP